MLPSVDSLLACLFMAEPPRGYSTAMPVSTLLWMLLPALPDFLLADASVANTGESLWPSRLSTVLIKAVLWGFSCTRSNSGTRILSGVEPGKAWQQRLSWLTGHPMQICILWWPHQRPESTILSVKGISAFKTSCLFNFVVSWVMRSLQKLRGSKFSSRKPELYILKQMRSGVDFRKQMVLPGFAQNWTSLLLKLQVWQARAEWGSVLELNGANLPLSLFSPKPVKSD